MDPPGPLGLYSSSLGADQPCREGALDYRQGQGRSDPLLFVGTSRRKHPTAEGLRDEALAEGARRRVSPNWGCSRFFLLLVHNEEKKRRDEEEE